MSKQFEDAFSDTEVEELLNVAIGLLRKERKLYSAIWTKNDVVEKMGLRYVERIERVFLCHLSVATLELFKDGIDTLGRQDFISAKEKFARCREFNRLASSYKYKNIGRVYDYEPEINAYLLNIQYEVPPSAPNLDELEK
jgi:hypothetical protein